MLISKTIMAKDEESGRFCCAEISICELNEVFGLSKDLNLWYFNRLFTPPEIRNKGYAKQAMNLLIEYLDENEIDLLCDINPYGDLSREQLEQFYRRYGFVNINDEFETLIRYHEMKK